MTVFKRKNRGIYYYKIRLAANQWRTCAGYTDKRATEEKMRQHQAQIERGEVGLVDPYADHKAVVLGEHIAAYVANLRAVGRDAMYCDNSERFLRRIAGDCGWQRLTDITPDGFVHWRNALQCVVPGRGAPRPASPKTKNAYLAAAKAFCNWMVQTSRMPANPLANLGGVEQRGREVRVRRALADAEIIRLLAVAGKYRTVYLMALTTGLRRGELKALRWGDIHLNAARPFIQVRATISKNHKTATLFLRQDVVSALRGRVGADADPVFDMPGRKRFKSHLLAAGINPKGPDGRVVDFHALRHSFITGLSKAGVSPRVAMELARHSQMDLTMRVYTDGGMLGSADAVNALPLWTPPMDPQQQKNMATGTLDDCGTKSGTKDGTKTGTLRFPPVPPHAHVSESPHSDETRVGTVKSDDSLAFNQSGRQDLNLRPLDPQSSALARLRHAPMTNILTHWPEL